MLNTRAVTTIVFNLKKGEKMMKSKMSRMLLLFSSIVMSAVLATSVSVAATVSDEVLNAAYDARLKNSDVQLNTDGMTLQQQLEVKKAWYELFHLNQSYDYSLEYFDIQIDTEVKQEALENWYDYL
jgi:hypothetical protein